MISINDEMSTFKRQAWLITFIGGCVLICLVAFGVQAIYHFNDVKTEWEKHSERATTISNTIADLNKNIGYGGFIHDFKNLILRRDIQRYQPTIEANITNVNLALDLLDSLLKLPEDQAAVAQLRLTFSEYMSKYHLVVQMIHANKNSAEIDSAVKISDTAALQARARLVARAGERSIETQTHAQATQKEAIRFMQYGGAILFVAILSAIATLIMFLHRVTSANITIQQTRKRLDTLLDTSPDPTISVFQDGKIARVNLMAEALFGYTRKELIGMSIENLIPERFRNKHHKLRAGFFSHPHNRMMGEDGNTLLSLARDGREIDVDISLSHSGEGIERLVTVTLRDMTETKRKEKEAQQMRDQLSQASKMESIGHITAGIAHDFNNILGAIMGYAELTQQKLAAGQPSAIASYQDAILKSGNRAKDLILQMLTFSRLSSNKNDEKAPVTLLAPIIDEAVKLLRASIPSSIAISYTIIDKDLKSRILPVQLHQVLLNLIVNAQDAIGKHGTIDISLSKQHYDKKLCDSCKTIISGNFSQITVKDNGEGITDDILNQIFEPFFTSKGLGKGTGMGLSVIHGLVHDQGGHLYVETILGHGTSFNILLPLKLSEDISKEQNEIIDQNVNIKGVRIMVVDDEEALCQMLNDYLSENGAEITWFTDPLKALDMFTQNSDQFDLVITDETMPGMTGMVLAENLLRSKPALPILLCTGYSDYATPESVKKIGVSYLLKKPINLNMLMIKIQDAINSKH